MLFIKKNYISLLLLSCLVLENIFLGYFLIKYFNTTGTDANKEGLNVACKKIEIGEELTSALDKMQNYVPNAFYSDEEIQFYFGDEVYDGPGVVFFINKSSYTVIRISCNGKTKSE